MRGSHALLAVVLALGLASPACASEESPPREPRRWEFEFSPYLWLTGNYGSVSIDGRTAQIKVSPIDMYHLLEDGNAFGGMGYLSFRYDRWSVFSDSVGGYAEEGVTEHIPTQLCSISVSATQKIKFVMADFALGYEIGRWALPKRQRPFTLGVYAGARYDWFKVRLRTSVGVAGGVQRAGAVDDSFSWADPLIGIRWSMPILDSVSLDFRGDIGGFGASSKLAWGLVGGVRYWLPWHPWNLQPYGGLGYRIVAFERDFGQGNDIELSFRGPTSAVGFVF
jgi:hypothetical protein